VHRVIICCSFASPTQASDAFDRLTEGAPRG
jgi:hypothetical protein